MVPYTQAVRSFSSALTAPIALKHEADRRIRVRADVLAGDVVHIVPGVGAFLRQRARGGAGDQNESNGGLGQHGHLLSRGRSHLAGVCLYLLRSSASSESAGCIATFGTKTLRRRRKARQMGVSGICAQACRN